MSYQAGMAKQERDVCPTCNTSRSMRQGMVFVINPDCYHEICTNCVDRFFAQGNRKCPWPTCNKTLRKAGYRVPTFGDMMVEQEVDVRKKVAVVFNQKEQDFEDLRAYNDYLNEVEDLVYDWLHVDAVAAAKKLESYRRQHTDIIIENAKRDRRNNEREKQMLREEEKETQRQRVQAMEDELAERQNEKQMKENARKAIIDKLATGQGDAEVIAREGEELLKMAKTRSNKDISLGTETIFIRGLKKTTKQDPEKPYDPFAGMLDVKEFVVLPQRPVQWPDLVNEFRKNKIYMAGGYNMNDFYGRALSDAFSGLDVFVKHEKIRERKGSAAVDTDVKMTDAF